MKRTTRIIIFFVLPAFIVLIIIALIALPYAAKNYINKHGKEYSGRKMSVSRVRINYFTTTFNIIGFKLFEADERTSFIAFDTLTVDVNPIRLFSSELEIEKVRLVNPVATIIRNDTRFNFDDIIAFYNSRPAEDADTVPSEPFKYVLKNISLENGKFTFTDKGVNHTSVMKNLGFSVPYISYSEEEISEAGLKFYFENDGFLQAKAGYNLKTGTYTADVTVSQLDISPFLPYTKDYIRLNNIEGLLGGNIHLHGNINSLDSLAIRGDGNIADFAASDILNRKVLGAKNGKVIMSDSYPLKYVFNFDKVTLTEPYLFFEMKDSTNNFLDLMVDTAQTGTVVGGASVEYYYKIGHLGIDSGLVDFRDNSYGDPFDYHLDKIQLKVDSFSSADKWLTAYSTMRLNKRGKMKAELGINPSDPYELKVNYVVTNFQLSDLNVISRYYVGFPILLGNMYYEGKMVIQARQLTSENKLIVRNAKLGKKSGGLMNIPLKLALYLLKDVHGDIILDLPLSGDLNDPKTKIGKLVWQVLKNVVTKVVASPFRALSGLMGVDPDEIRGIQFNYGDTTLTDAHLRRIRLFTELEEKKPDMKIELVYYNDVEIEKQQIAIEEAGKRFKSATGADYTKEKAQFSSFLAEKLQKDTIDMVSGSALLIGSHQIDSIHSVYTRMRISEIESALHAANDSSKINIFIPDKEVPENVGSRPVFELKFSIDE